MLNMIPPSNIYVYISTVLIASLRSCVSQPTVSASVIDNNDIESPQILKATVSEIVGELGENSAENTIPIGDSDYRRYYATLMLSYMNHTVNPCDDFYEYACGNWKNMIEDHMSLTKRNNILDIAFKLDDIVEQILQRSSITDVAPEYSKEFEMAKDFYHNCLNADLYPMRASTEYLRLLKEIGGFPALETNWNSENFHWLNMSAHLSNYGISGFVHEGIATEYPFPPYFRIPNFGFDISLHHDTVENKSSNAYKENEKRIHDILATYGVDKKRLDSVISEIFDFLKEILIVSKEFDDNDYICEELSKSMNESNIAVIKEKWRIYYDIAWFGKNIQNATKDFEECCLPCWFFYEKLDKICEANKQAAANYLSLKFLFHMDTRLKDKKFQRGYCISSIKSSMLYFFDHLYMKIYFNDDIRSEINDISKEIRQSLRLILQDANWLDESTRKAALLKESRIAEDIGRYEDPNVTTLLLGELAKLQYINGSYEANNLNLRKFKQYMTRFNGLHFEKLSNTTKPLQVLVGMQPECFYYNLDNSIYVMAGSLLPPVYNSSWPNSLKFGTLGYIIGHEFTHGFDTMGAGYDEYGQENYWWSEKSSKVFEERSKCFIDHFHSYLVPEINRNLNGDLTKDENIADSGGLREALMAYRRYIKNITKDFDPMSSAYREEQLPGMDMSPEQLFFLGFAQLWCASYNEANYWEELKNEHTIDKYRVVGVLSNNDDFAKVYNCPVGSKMNPSPNKCKLW